MRSPRRDGFTLLEVVVVIAVLSILASVAVPFAAQVINQSREENTRKEMEQLQAAIAGDPGVPTPGYVGDMGRLPTALAQLDTRGAQPAGGTGTLGVRVGWFGPYMNSGFDAAAYLTDAWGTPYAYGNPGTGQIRSAGPDRAMGTADDIILPPNPVAATGSLLVNLYVWSSTPAPGQFILNPQPAAFPGMTATVVFHYSNGGVEAQAAGGTPSGPPYAFGVPLGFHSGFHAVTASVRLPPDPATATQAVVYLPGGNQQTQLSLYLR